jgi:hypothetical protein
LRFELTSRAEHRIIHRNMLLVHASFQLDQKMEFLIDALEGTLNLSPLQARAVHRPSSG